MSKIIIISNSNELVRVPARRVVSITSEGNYCTMLLHDGTRHMFTMNLSSWHKLLEEQLGEDSRDFIRIGKQLIVNRTYIYKINLSKQQLVLSDYALNEAVTLTASRDGLRKLKELLEKGKERA